MHGLAIGQQDHTQIAISHFRDLRPATNGFEVARNLHAEYRTRTQSVTGNALRRRVQSAPLDEAHLHPAIRDTAASFGADIIVVVVIDQRGVSRRFESKGKIYFPFIFFSNLLRVARILSNSSASPKNIPASIIFL